MSAYDELLARIDALEQGIALDQLPLRELRSTLIENGEPLDLSTLALAPTKFPLVTSLPSGAGDGDEVYYLADATNGVIWHLKYRANSSSTYKWEFVGGGSLYAEVATGQGTTSTPYVDLATVGPNFTLPLAGVYDLEWGADSQAYTAQQYMGIGTYIAGVWTLITHELIDQASTAAGGIRHGTTTSDRVTVATAATEIRARYHSSGGTSLTWWERWLRATPVRVT